MVWNKRIKNLPRGPKHHFFGKTKENSEWARKSSERMKLNNPQRKLNGRFVPSIFCNESCNDGV